MRLYRRVLQHGPPTLTEKEDKLLGKRDATKYSGENVIFEEIDPIVVTAVKKRAEKNHKDNESKRRKQCASKQLFKRRAWNLTNLPLHISEDLLPEDKQKCVKKCKRKDMPVVEMAKAIIYIYQREPCYEWRTHKVMDWSHGWYGCHA